MNELIVFPTELALRRFQQEEALRTGFVDASNHTTFARLRQCGLSHLRLKGRRMSPAKELLLRKQVVEVAKGHFVDGGPLGGLSESALADVLQQLLVELAALPEETGRIVDWMLSRSPKHKLYQLGMLFSVWRATLQQEGFLDRIDLNSALLKLLKGSREKWPPILRDTKRLTFRSVRWFNPFEEACIVALNQKLKLRIESALPAAHAEESEDRLGQQIRAEIMAEPWAVWAEDLGDALAVDSSDLLQLDDAARISFSRSAGAYGEIEDLARRMGWHLETYGGLPNRIALVVPNIGTVQDIIPHVFGRFQIPYYFRRGRPVLSSPCVKAFLAWLAFPLRAERDVLIDLVRNPAIQFVEREETVAALLKMPPRLTPESLSYFKGMETCSGKRAAEMMAERIVAPEDHFNTEALETVGQALEEFGAQNMPLHDLIDLLEELLENATVRPRNSHEQGVWILNPRDDAVGLDFDLVLFSGLNEGEFPGVPQQDALLSDAERRSLWKHLEAQGRRLPKLALPTADVLFEQERVLFLTAVGMAREQLVLSCQAVDQEGNEKSPGEYYRKLWNLTGWPSLASYDQWRIEQLGEDSIFAHHWRTQQAMEWEERIPMPGESFLPIVPLPLCRARDEALQAAVQGGRDAGDTNAAPQTSGLPTEKHLMAMLEIEAERNAFLESPTGDRPASIYCGWIPSLKEQVVEWFEKREALSPTALETLAQCRYVFLLERVFGLRDPRVADDAPDPMERGGLIHSILQEIYSAIANAEAGIDTPRYWAVKTAQGWVKRTVGGTGAIPLASFVPERAGEYEAFAEKIARRRMNEVLMGHPGVWAAEREKVLVMVLNFVRYDVATCASENRFPALFELAFSGESTVELEGVQLKGIIDRVDLVFAETGALERVRVLDYKGASRARSKPEDYIDEIHRNLDCQLPVYALAAQQYLFGECNTESTNALTEAGYLFYERDDSKIGAALKKSLIPMDEPGLLTGFLETLFENIRRLKSGDFAVDPLIASYNDYQSVCRVEAVQREDLD